MFIETLIFLCTVCSVNLRLQPMLILITTRVPINLNVIKQPVNISRSITHFQCCITDKRNWLFLQPRKDFLNIPKSLFPVIIIATKKKFILKTF